MALNFPANPSVGQVYNTGLKTWKWSGNSWTTLGVGEGTVIATSETPPLNPSIGDLWFNDNTAVLSVFYSYTVLLLMLGRANLTHCVHLFADEDEDDEVFSQLDVMLDSIQ